VSMLHFITSLDLTVEVPASPIYTCLYCCLDCL